MHYVPNIYSASGLGQVADRNTPEVRRTVVQPGALQPWLSAALTVQGVGPTDAPRLSDAVRATLTRDGARVRAARWGSDSIRGRLYVEWEPNAGRNAVDYANDMVRVFATAGDEFPGRPRIIMPRYRINGTFSDLYVYPEAGGASPSAALQAAVNAPRDPEGGGSPESSGGKATKIAMYAGIGGGAVLLIGGGAWLWSRRSKVAKNRRRR